MGDYVQKNLKELRRRSDLTQIDLARASRVSRSRIQLAEAGTVELRAEEIDAIRRALKPRLERTAELIAANPEFRSETEQD